MLFHARIQHLQALLPLAAADDLADARGQHIHGRHGALVVVQAHVEGLDVLRVVHDHHRPAHVLFGQVALVLGGQVLPPGHRELERLAAVGQDIDDLAVVHALEGLVYHRLQAADGGLVDVLGEEGHVVLPLFQHPGEQVLEQGLRQVGVVVQVGEGDLRLHHPELRQVAAGVGVLGAESGPEGIDLAHGQAVGLHLQLARDREEGLAAEKVLAEIHLPRGGARQVGEIQGADPEQLAGALAIAAGDDGGVDPVETLVVEIVVDGVGQGAAHPGDGADGVGARAQVGLAAQVLEAVAFLGDGIGLGVVHPAQHRHRAGLDLHALALALGGHQLAGDSDRATRGQLQDLVLVVGQGSGHHRLDGVEAGAVVHGQEGNTRLGIALAAQPAAHADLPAAGHLGGQGGLYRYESAHAAAPTWRCG